MKGDFTRNTFDPRKHFEQVLMQQGRVQLDADWNEQGAIALRRDQTTTEDIVGDCGGPAGNAAFGVLVTAPAGMPNAAVGDFYLSAGRYYVDGVQCELERPVLFTQQPDRVGVAPLGAGDYVLALDVWRRHLTVLDDPSIREQALGGPDTASRAKTVWQVKALPASAADVTALCAAQPAALGALRDPGTARMAARLSAAPASSDPCTVPGDGGFTGLENQLYRVEMHDPDNPGNKAIWKWSRDNGSVVFAVESIDPAQKLVTVATVGPDSYLGLAKGQRIEILDDSHELDARPGQLFTIVDIDRDARTVLLDRTPTVLDGGPTGIAKARHPKLRRWDGIGETLPPNSKWAVLENGIEVFFSGGGYRTGQYWQIPARAATSRTPRGEIEWPTDPAAPANPLALPPAGIDHHVCELGLIRVAAAGVTVLADCRCIWPALAHVPRLFYVSGDGQEVMPDLTEKPPTTRYKLPQPLVVGIGNGQCLTTQAQVRFTITIGDGRVTPVGTAPGAAKTIDVPIGLDGLARCDFHLDGATLVQQVRARLLDGGVEVSMPILFNANLSIADQVAYDSTDCPGLEGKRTVQQAIDRIVGMRHLTMVAGDGQDGAASTPLPNPIVVNVGSICRPVDRVDVTFIAIKGSVLSEVPNDFSPPRDERLTVPTDAEGNATCFWQLAANPAVQELRARVTPKPNEGWDGPTELVFTANVRTSGTGCCRTIGEGGDFPTLDQAMEVVAKGGRGAFCFCLLPGRHRTKGFELRFPPGEGPQLDIHGAGQGSQVVAEDRIAFLGLGSVALHDFAITVSKIGGPQARIVIGESSSIELANLDILGDQKRPSLAFVGALDRLTVTGCTVVGDILLFGDSGEIPPQRIDAFAKSVLSDQRAFRNAPGEWRISHSSIDRILFAEAAEKVFATDAKSVAGLPERMWLSETRLRRPLSVFGAGHITCANNVFETTDNSTIVTSFSETAMIIGNRSSVGDRYIAATPTKNPPRSDRVPPAPNILISVVP